MSIIRDMVENSRGLITNTVATDSEIALKQDSATLLADMKAVDGAGSGLDADKVDGFGVNNTAPFNTPRLAVMTGASGLMEIGRYIDFHTTNSTTDYDVRLDCNSGNGTAIGGTLNILGAGLLHNGQKVWTQNNDGAGSGLDADLLDGLDSTSFLRSDGDDVANGRITNIHNTPAISVSSYTQGGIEIRTNDGSHPILGFHTSGRSATVLTEQSGQLYVNNNVDATLRKVWTAGNDGAGSGLDADKVDGLDSTAFALNQGDNTKTFKVADAVLIDEAVSKAQLDTKITASNYSTATVGGTAKMRVDVATSTLYITTNGVNA